MITGVVQTAIALMLAASASAATLPPWAREVTTTGASEAAADALVLIDHTDVVIGADGKMRTIRRYAVLVRDRAGREAAALRAVYVPGSGSVKAIKAWLAKGSAVREVDGRAVVDAALVNNDVYNEVRVRSLGAQSDVAAGEIFVAELESEEQVLFSQFEWDMQHEWPSRLWRRTLTLPQGWRATSLVFNGAAIVPRHDAGRLVWEQRDLPALPEEPSMPPYSDVAPRVAVSVFAPGSMRAPGQFESWQSVAQWLHGLSDGSSAAAAAVTAKARELTQGAATDFDRAAAIARFAQRVQYISIQTGLGRGGGYQPRPASIVLERNYGDCKDKASLMRAMLSAVGVRSALVSLYSGDRNYVRAEWPSPQQFNHAIIAIAVQVPADRTAFTVTHPALGPLLMFDPTDEHTPFGELPLDEQGSLALVVHPQTTALARLPLLPTERHATNRAVTGTLAANGALTVSVEERYTGSAATVARGLRSGLDAESYRELLTRRVGASIPRARISGITQPSTEPTLAFTAEAPSFAQDSGSLVLVPMPFELNSLAIPAGSERRTPVLLEPHVVSETVQLTLPAGLIVDEVQTPVRIESPFGRYSLEFTAVEGSLQARRRLEVPMQRIEPARLPEARAFFERVRRADTEVVVLRRK